ncbi:protein kinase C-binding protein 1 isoform X2 [Drosophila innubila]|uniref:protein kinase C-binding protein 1 isoform X2 n=1 Tax=Drosophila innubila TaxID=198719 RepID=UPI00148BBD21|nr:protein kinase C-binding protein 1 isoform X2 [Drosophila innubila]
MPHMDSSDDDDSAKSIPRPIYEATSAIDSPPPQPHSQSHLLSANNEMEPLPVKRLKYVVSSPPGSANGSSSSNSNTWPVSAANSAGTGGHASLTMKLTKVTTPQQSEPKPGNTSTPKQDNRTRVPREVLALQRSHNESQVLTGFVSDNSKVKRRKSRAVAAQLIKQCMSTTLPSTKLSTNPKSSSNVSLKLKRSKSIPAPMCDSQLDTKWHQEPELHKHSKSKTQKKRNYSVNYDDVVVGVGVGYVADELSAGEESNSNTPSYVTNMTERFRSRSKTVSLSSEERQPRRGNLRSENEEFARKHNAFLDRVINDTEDGAQSRQAEADSGHWRTSSTADTDPNISMYSDVSESKTMLSTTNAAEEIEQRLDELWRAPPRDGWDPFCWKCRDCGKLMPCSKCLRSYHTFCVRPATTKFDGSWKCPECVLIESAPKRPRRSDVSVELLSQLLSFALERMRLVRGVYKLRAPQEVLPESCSKYFVNPVSFESLSERIKNRAFHSADEFLSEVKWMQHNALILDSGDVKVEQASKAVVKVCRQEANEIDTCAECYLNANSSDEWFVKVCTTPHLLLWAKLKGFPYWPAKAMGSGPNSVVNVRFFGKHDRANVPVKDCFLYCAQDPNTQTSRRSARDLADCIREVEVHIEHIRTKIGSFNYAPYRKPYDPLEEQQQLEEMMPGVNDMINRHLAPANKTPLQFLIRKTAGDKLSIVKKTKATESGNESDQSGSPIKKPMQETESPPPPPTTDPPKPKSSNYEVIPRAGDALRESRGCTVVLKRKSLESCKTPVKSAPEAVSSIKRKHSQSDASSETSQQGTSSEHKRRPKHARKQMQESTEMPHQEQASAPVSLQAEEASIEEPKTHTDQGTAENVLAEANPSVVSVVELVRRRQGVTITKIPREQQHAAMGAATTSGISRPSDSNPIEATANETVAKQRAVERQQQQLISKVVPFVEIKKEVLSEPEESEELPPVTQLPAREELQQQQSEAETTAATETTAPTTVAPPEPVQAVSPPPPPATGNATVLASAGIQIKEEVVSEEEMETEQDLSSRNPTTDETPMPPPPLPHRTDTHPSIVSNVSTPATTTVPQVSDSFVRFVGDTTIQRVSQKQAPKLPETTKRCPLRGVPHGPLPAAALSPPQTSPSAPPSPSPSPSPKLANSCSNSRTTTQASPKAQSQKSPVAQQLRVKSDKSLGPATSPPPHVPPTPTSSLLKSNMVVIPMDPRNTNGGNSSNSSINTGNSSNLSSSNLMTIPVPPLRAVSKNTLQTTTGHTAITAVPLPAPAFPNSTLPPPPLAGLTTATTVTATSTPKPTANTESGGLLANALNGLPSDTLVSESTVSEPITPGVATALSELMLRSGPPKLTARPCGPLHSDGSSLYPAQAGPLSMRLKDNAHKITDYFISVIEDTLSDLACGEPSVMQARIAALTLENERIKQHYERQLADMQRSTDLMIAEMRKTMEQENKRVISELRQHSTLERMRAVEDAKKKQWCANCMREAQLYCCWNTSYCDYPCQQMHWQRHSSSCGQAATLQAQLQTPQQSQLQAPQQQTQPQVQTMHVESTRGNAKQKTMPNNTLSPGQQLNRTQAVTATVGGSKKWSHQSMISMVNPAPPTTEVLKLPNNTFLRPVSLPSAAPSTSNNNNIATPVTLIAPASSTHLGNTVLPGQRNNLNYGGKPTQPISVQRYNIPLPITVSSNNAGSFGLISEQHQKQVAKSTGRNSAKNNSNRGRNPNNQMNNNSNVQAMRHNQLNHVYQQ